MTTIGYGDLARTVPLTRHGVEARADLARLSQELTTGRHGDVAAAERGDLRAVAGIERSLGLLGRSEAAAISAQGRMAVMQSALEGVQDAARQVAGDLTKIAGPAATAALGQAETTSRAALGGALSALSAQMGGVHLFSGTATDRAPLPAMDEMLAALRAEVDGEADAATFRARVQAWFAPGGGMDVASPLPGRDVPAVMPLAPGEALRIEATAADPAIRATLADLAIGVLAGEGQSLGPEARVAALSAAGVALLGDDAGVTHLRGRLGSAEGQSERALARIRTETAALEIARGEALEVDRYEVATQFQAAEAGLETLYLVTARLSGLSLANYFR